MADLLPFTCLCYSYTTEATVDYHKPITETQASIAQLKGRTLHNWMSSNETNMTGPKVCDWPKSALVLLVLFLASERRRQAHDISGMPT